MSKREVLLQEFKDYISTFKEIDISPEDEESECSLKLVSPDKSYWYQKELIPKDDPLFPLVKSIKRMAMKKRSRRYHEIIMKRYCNTKGNGVSRICN